MDSFRSRHDRIQVFLFRVCTFVVGDRAGSGEPVLLIGPETERAEGGCSRHGEKGSGQADWIASMEFLFNARAFLSPSACFYFPTSKHV